MIHSIRCLSIVLFALLSVPSAQAQDIPAAPEGGQALVDAGLQSFEVGPDTTGNRELVDVAGPGFDKAIRMVCTQRGERWDVETRMPLPAAFQRGDVVLLRLWARAIETTHESGQALFAASVAMSNDPWRDQFSRALSVGREWEHFDIPGRIEQDWQSGEITLKFSAGFVPQTLEIGGVELIHYGQGVAVEDLPNTRVTYAGREADATWRAEARQRIEEHRMAALTVRVIDAMGEPVADAEVSVKLVRNAFDFGTMLLAWQVVDQSDPVNETYRRKFLELFNAGSFGNALKWPAWNGEWGERHTREVTMAALQWMQDRGIPCRGHVMIWPGWHNLPRSLEPLRDGADPEALQNVVLAHIDDIALTTRGYVSEWDLINEPYHNHDLMDICGRGAMVEWFKRAQARLPGVPLAINEFNILTALSDNPQQEHFEETLGYLLNEGAPVDVIGIQGHFASSVPSPERMLVVLDRFAKFGLPIRVTEYTLENDDESLRYDFTRDVLTVLYSHPSVVGFQMWGIGQAVNEDGSLTVLGKAYRELVHETWRTEAAGQTDAEGAFTTRGHLGRYGITVTHGGGTQQLTFDLTQDGPAMMVRVGD